jgi:hypothetical protein
MARSSETSWHSASASLLYIKVRATAEIFDLRSEGLESRIRKEIGGDARRRRISKNTEGLLRGC